MHGITIAALIVSAWLGPAGPGSPADLVAEARRRLDRGDGPAAVAILEDALADAPSPADREAVLGLLPKAYDAAARQAEAAGRAREAESYRENGRILARKARPSTPTTPAAPSPPPPAEAPTAPTPLPEPVAPPEMPATRSAPVAPSDLLPLPVEPPAIDVASGDSAFAARDWAEAGRIYAALAAEKRLPDARRDHWAYCRAQAVAARINARPKTEADWASIDAEIEQIRALNAHNPNNWLPEYLRRAAAERPTARAKPSRPIIRANSPDEPPARDRPVRTASNTPPAEPVRPAPSPAPATVGPVARWQLRETANFKIYHVDPALADKVAMAAEATRRDQGRRWTDAQARAPWQPHCEIYLYPTAKHYAQMTGQPEDSPGFSTMGMNEGRIISRRVNLRADHPGLVAAVLPHEVTHVILADSFTVQQIPRWADEGMAVLSEPLAEQERRAADLTEPLGKNVLFPVDVLMGMDYPDAKYWSLYYAQCVSLTRFLVEQGTPAQLVQFLKGSEKAGFEAELRRVYNIDGFPDLQARWVAYARSKAVPTRTAAAPAAPVR